MKRAVVTAPGVLHVEDVVDPAPGPGQALVVVESGGVCGSDIGLLHGKNALASYPVVPGHECVGRVESAPDGAGVAPGDHVVVFPTLTCGACRACGDGRENHCAQMRVLGLSAPNGCFAERIAVDVGQLIPVPSDLAARYGALIEPVAVAVHVNRRGGTRPGDRMLIIGAGVIGILTALVARARGAAAVLLADRLIERRTILDRLGLTQFSVAEGAALTEWVRDASGDVDIVYDTVVNPATVATSIDVLCPGGVFVPVASPKPGQQVTLPYDLLYARELTVAGCRNYARSDFAGAIELLAAGAIEPDDLVTDRVALDELDAAIRRLTADPAAHLKVLVEP